MGGKTVDIGRQAIPMVSYEDVAAAADWLVATFGFHETGPRYSDETGRVTHAELELGGATVMLGWPGHDYQSPRHHADVCERARKWLSVPYIVDGVHISVDEVDRHFEHARTTGARILRKPKDEYGRLYNAEDLEGHRWMFMQAVGT